MREDRSQDNEKERGDAAPVGMLGHQPSAQVEPGLGVDGVQKLLS